MLIEGIVERIDGATVSGWVRCSSKEDRVIVRLFVESIAVAEVEANQVRSDLTTKISVGFGYRCTADVVRAYFGKCPNLAEMLVIVQNLTDIDMPGEQPGPGSAIDAHFRKGDSFAQRCEF